MSKAELLASTPLFGRFAAEELEPIAGASSARQLARGDVLFRENDPAAELYVVADGRVAIANRGRDGRESVVALMEPGEVFGEMGLFDGLGRSAEARALEESAVLVVPYEPVEAAFEARPLLLWDLVALLTRRLRSTDEALADTVFLDVAGRTAKRLLELAGDNDELTLPITQEELAAMVGASRERVNKALATFVRLGWLDQRERHYVIVNREELSRRAQ